MALMQRDVKSSSHDRSGPFTYPPVTSVMNPATCKRAFRMKTWLPALALLFISTMPLWLNCESVQVTRGHINSARYRSKASRLLGSLAPLQVPTSR